MSYQKLVNLVFKIANATSRGALSWKETEQDDIYQVSFSSSSVRIGERRSKLDPNAPEFYLKIVNSVGEEIESVGDEDGSDDEERADLYIALKETYETARRQSTGVDQALDEILSELDDDVTF